ncbi:MAG: cysteine hydrolase [Candidatus Lokiarchaeota archaeon]|nr:cysteine hydrolase [Candidatus Lokiarchaeota archaeon]
MGEKVLVRNSVLLIIDVQVGLFSIENFPIYQEESFIQNILNLIIKAKKANVKIIFIQHNGSKGDLLETGTKNWEIHPKLQPKKEDIKIQKFQSDSFFETNLDEELKKSDTSHLVIAGLMTPMCIDTTVRSAFSHGYEVTLIQDTHSTINSEILTASSIIAHHNDVLQWFANIKKENEFNFT